MRLLRTEGHPCRQRQSYHRAHLYQGEEGHERLRLRLDQSHLRSESAKYNLFIQLSREMWDFDEDGEIYYEKALQGFIPELLRRWRAVPTNHILTVILFARVHYDESELHMLEGPIRQDQRARHYIDYYKVVVDLESNCDWDVVMTILKEEFFRFQHDILLLRRPISGPAASHEELHAELIRDRVHMAGRLSYSYEGNLLEAINLALNPFDEHYIDRDLNRTGLSMVFVTAGTGHFDVDKKLLRVTTERMIENGTGLDLVCLTKMPLHSTPLFHFKSHWPDPSELKQSQAASNSRSQRRPGTGAGPGMTVHRPVNLLCSHVTLLHAWPQPASRLPILQPAIL